MLSESLMIFCEAVKAIRMADRWRTDDQMGYWSACALPGKGYSIHGSYYHDRDLSDILLHDASDRYRGVVCDEDGMVYNAVDLPDEDADILSEEAAAILRSFFSDSIVLEQLKRKDGGWFISFRFTDA